MTANDALASPWLRPAAALSSLLIGLGADVVTVAGVLATLGVQPLDQLLPHAMAEKVIAAAVIISALSKAHLATSRSIVPSVDTPSGQSSAAAHSPPTG